MPPPRAMKPSKKTRINKFMSPRDQLMSQRIDSPSLLPELMVEILSRSSSIDLVNAKLCCKEVRELAEEEYVYKRVCLNDFPIAGWNKAEAHASFFNKCLLSKNSEALYRQGVVDYFHCLNMESALKHLNESANYGHTGASYAAAIILLMCGNESEQKAAATTLLNMRKSTIVKHCRENLCGIIRTIWTAHSLIVNRDQLRSRKRCLQHREHTGWENKRFGSRDDEKMCEDCVYEEELEDICNAL